MALKEFIQKDFQSLLSIQACNRPGLDIVMDIIAKLLEPDQPESGSYYIGELIHKLLQKGGHMIAPIVPSLLQAVIRSVHRAKTATFTQTLVLVFAHLMHHQLPLVINLLAETAVQDENGLTVLCRVWYVIGHV